MVERIEPASMLAFLLAVIVLYVIVRTAARHGHMDAEQARIELERYEAFEQMIESGNLPDAPAPERPEAP